MPPAAPGWVGSPLKRSLPGPPGLQPEANISVSSTTGRHGSRFQLVLPGCAISANCQWQMNCARMPAVSASGDSASTSAHASSAAARVPGLSGGRPPGRRREHPQAGQASPLRPLGVVDKRRRIRRGRGGRLTGAGSSQERRLREPHPAADKHRRRHGQQGFHPASATYPEFQEVWAARRPDTRRPRRRRSPCRTRQRRTRIEVSATAAPRISSHTGLVSFSAAV